MPKHNNVRPGGQIRKDQWKRWIKTHFNQPGKKRRRQVKRRQKAARKAPRPMNQLRPIVQCNSLRYNMRARLGRGFTPMELKKAGVQGVRYARTIGIKVDLRRKNKSVNHMVRNVKRLKKYVGNLVLWPLEPYGKDKKNKEKMVAYLQAKEEAKMKMAGHWNQIRHTMPFKHEKKVVQLVKMDDVPDYDCWGTMRQELIWKQRHFRYRRRDLRAHRWRLIEAARAAKKKAKGK